MILSRTENSSLVSLDPGYINPIMAGTNTTSSANTIIPTGILKRIQVLVLGRVVLVTLSCILSLIVVDAATARDSSALKAPPKAKPIIGKTQSKRTNLAPHSARTAQGRLTTVRAQGRAKSQPMGSELDCTVPSERDSRQVHESIITHLWQWTQAQSRLRPLIQKQAQATIRVATSSAQEIQLGVFDVLRASLRRLNSPAVLRSSVFRPLPQAELIELLGQTKTFPNWSCLEQALIRPEIQDSIFGGHSIAKNESHPQGPVAIAMVHYTLPPRQRRGERIHMQDVYIGLGRPSDPRLYRYTQSDGQVEILQYDASASSAPRSRGRRHDRLLWTPAPHGTLGPLLEVKEQLIAQADASPIG